jgi:hypothetical protein
VYSWGIKYVNDLRLKISVFINPHIITNVRFMERVKAFFEIPPKHNLKVGDLVTCTCHGGVAVIIELFDDPIKVDYPKMNMAKIWWISRAHNSQSRVWMHTIGRLNKYGSHWPE